MLEPCAQTWEVEVVVSAGKGCGAVGDAVKTDDADLWCGEVWKFSCH